jgi:hypothetical protein
MAQTWATAWYPHTRETTPIHRDLTWEALRDTLTKYRPHTGTKEERLKAAPLWSPARIEGTRRASHVIEVSCLVLDHDDGETVADAASRWSRYAHIVYTTWSHTDDEHRCRVVVPLERPVPGRMWSRVYRDTMQRLGIPADPACSDPCRMYYVPCVGNGGPHMRVAIEGPLLDLLPRAVELHEDHLAREKRRAEEAERRAAALQRRVDTIADEARAVIEVMQCDASARRRAAEQCGGQITADGARARRALCPSCGRGSVWWYIDSDGPAMCDHAKSCGYRDGLGRYLLTLAGR